MPLSAIHDPSFRPKPVAVFVFGRFNPPTLGHARLIEAGIEESIKHNGDFYTFVSHTVDVPAKKTGKVDPEKSKNPLNWQQKVEFMQQLFGDVNIVRDPSVLSPHHVLEYLKNKHSEVIFVVGEDRVPEFKTRWLPYTKEDFNHGDVVSCGHRDPDAEGIVGMSGTKARLAARNNNLNAFATATGWDATICKHMMEAVQIGMGVE